MNGMHQSKWTSMTSGDSDMLWTDDVVSRGDSVALLALDNVLVMLDSWSG
jgi:hypothetical protein